MIATDVASWGLDIPDVDLVIQTSPPTEIESYIHRSGRTAWAGKEGKCITLFDSKNSGVMKLIEQNAGFKFNVIGMPNTDETIKVKIQEVVSHIEHFNNPKILSYFEKAAKELAVDAETNIKKLLAIASGVHWEILA